LGTFAGCVPSKYWEQAVKNKNQFSARDHQLLSAYIDGELSSKDKKYVERLLSENSNVLKTIEKIKKVKALLKYLPTRKVPRNFTITAQKTRRFYLPSFAGVFRYSTAVSAVLLVIVLTLDYFSLFQTPTNQLSKASLAEKLTMVEDTGVEVGRSAPIITWHPAYPQVAEGFGYEGGGGDSSGMGGMPPQPLIPDSLDVPQESFSAQIPIPEAETPLIEGEQLPQVVEEQPQSDTERSALESKSPVYGNGPILGIRPVEEQGEIRSFVVQTELTIEDTQVFSFRLVKILLAGLVLVSALLTFFLRKQKK
ncbi:MAG: hypothetical protein Q7J07_06425, partial [Pelolinea sp.]|nr:hypothetical protein [Pelolinea sp.]